MAHTGLSEARNVHYLHALVVGCCWRLLEEDNRNRCAKTMEGRDAGGMRSVPLRKLAIERKSSQPNLDGQGWISTDAPSKVSSKVEACARKPSRANHLIPK